MKSRIYGYGRNFNAVVDNQIVKHTATNEWYRCLIAGYRLAGIETKHITVKVEQ